MPNDEVRMTRQQIYDLVWSKPIEQVAEALGVPLGNLTRTCREHNIPFPGISHWWPSKNGAKPKVENLPHPPGLSQEVTLPIRNTPAKRTMTTKAATDPVTVKSTPAIGASNVNDAENGPTGNTTDGVVCKTPTKNATLVHATLHQPHPYVVQSKSSLENGTQDGRYLLLLPSKTPCLDIRVSKHSLDRSLRIMDALLKALEASGISVQLSSETKTSTIAVIGDENIYFGIDEITRRVTGERKWSDPQFLPTGILALHLRSKYGSYNYKEWKDGKRRRLEEVVNDFVDGVQKEAEQDRLQRLERESQQREREELRRIQEEELAKSKRLDVDLESWHKAQKIRAFLAAVRQKMEAEHHVIEPDSELARWLEWTSRQADKLDPLLSSPLFRNVTKPQVAEEST